MSEAAAPPAAPTSAPTTAPSAPATPPAAGNAPAPPSGQQTPAAPAARTPVHYKTKHRIGDAEHELEIDVAPFLESYKRKLKLDGEEVEVGLDDAYKSYERSKPSFKRFEEASALLKKAETRASQVEAQIKTVEDHLTDPARAVPLMKKALGPKYLGAVASDIRALVMSGDAEAIRLVADITRERIEYEKLPTEERARRDRMTDHERRAAEREAAIAAREREAAQRERQAKAAEEKRVSALRDERIKQLTAEIVPMLDAAGIPVKRKDGTINERWVREVGREMRDAIEQRRPMTLAEAVAKVKADHDELIEHATERQRAAQLQSIQEQPGRGAPPQPPATPPRAPNGRFERSEQSLEDIRRELRNNRR